MAEGCLPPPSPDPRHHERDYANALYVNQSYSRNDRATDRLARHLHTVNFNMKAEDLDQPWFFKQASREIALSLLTNRDSGSFLVRPSSQRGCYALSYVTPTGEIRHDLIYDLYPGFSLQKNPNPTSHERYWSLSALIENCPYLKFTSGLDNKSNAKDVRSAQAKSIVEIFGRINDMLLANDPSLVELRWNLSVLESPSSGPQHRTSFSKLEKRTYIHYSDADYIAPEILPCNNAFANLLAAALSNNTTLTSLTIGGHLGSDIQKRNYVENISDEGAMILAGALVSNKCLAFLDLSVNRIEDRGAEFLARALYSNRTLKKLNLCRNFITPNGLFELAQSLVRNFVLDELLVGNQLRATHQGNSVVCSDYQRNLVNLIEHTLKRKRELLGRELLHGYMEKTTATKRLQLVKREGRLLPGSFLLYLRRSIPNVIFLACAVDVKKIKTEQARGSKVPPFLLNRIEEHEKRKKHKQLQVSSVSTSATSSSSHSHQHITNGNGTSFSTTATASSSSSSTKDKVMIVHKAIYKGNYKYSFSRMGCLSPGSKPEVPSLFDHCSWVICSDEQLYQTSMAIFPEEISDRIAATKLLQPLWGIRSVPEKTEPYTQGPNGYFSLEQLIKFNSSWLVRHNQILPKLRSSSATSSTSSSPNSGRTPLSNSPFSSFVPTPSPSSPPPSSTTSSPSPSPLSSSPPSTPNVILPSHSPSSFPSFLFSSAPTSPTFVSTSPSASTSITATTRSLPQISENGVISSSCSSSCSCSSSSITTTTMTITTTLEPGVTTLFSSLSTNES